MPPLNYLASADLNFASQLRLLALQSATVYLSVAAAGQRAWAIPDPGDGPTWDYSLYSLTGPTGMNQAFRRNNSYVLPGLNEQYVVAHTAGNGTQAEATSAKYQIDELAAMERAFRLRHATHVRCQAHAAARRGAHGSPLGVIYRKIKAANDFLLAGAIEPAFQPSPVFTTWPEVEVGLTFDPDA